MPIHEAQQAVAEEFDSYGSSYRDEVNKSLIVPGLNVDYFAKVKAGYLADLTTSHFGKTNDLSLLDVGCGIGNYHSLIKRCFGRICGVDVSAKSIELARLAHPDIEYKVYDGFCLPYADSSFDIAYAICVVHHVPQTQWEAFAAELHRVCKLGGMAIIFEHNPRNPLTMRSVNRCAFDKDAVLLSSKRAVNLLLGAGFRQIETRTILSIPSIGPKTRKYDRILGKMPFGAQYYVAGVK